MVSKKSGGNISILICWLVNLIDGLPKYYPRKIFLRMLEKNFHINRWFLRIIRIYYFISIFIQFLIIV